MSSATTAAPAGTSIVYKNYIKETNPSLYEFFLDYWNFIKGYWRIYNEEDWWNCLISDMDYYVTKYSWSNFCVNLLMAFYNRCKDERPGEGESLDETKIFLKEWWQYINKYYKRGNEDAKWWEDFLSETGDITEKYKNSPYYCSLVDEFVKIRAKD